MDGKQVVKLGLVPVLERRRREKQPTPKSAVYPYRYQHIHMYINTLEAPGRVYPKPAHSAGRKGQCGPRVLPHVSWFPFLQQHCSQCSTCVIKIYEKSASDEQFPDPHVPADSCFHLSPFPTCAAGTRQARCTEPSVPAVSSAWNALLWGF